jgi:cell division protein ZipA
MPLAAELRWILLGLSCLLLAGIWWWGSRRSAQAPGNPELRETTAGRMPESVLPEPVARDWGVPPFEPLSIRTDDYDRVPVLDEPMMVHAESVPPLEALAVGKIAAPLVPTDAASPDLAPGRESSGRPIPVVVTVGDNSGRFAATAPQPANLAQLQRIVTLRVCGDEDALWSGAQLMAALESLGLSFGRYQVFHRKHADGRSLFCVASLIEPGTFDIAAMPEQEFRGVTLFAVLPGPMAPLETFDALLATARGLAHGLSGAVQDSTGTPLSAQRAASMREDVAGFQAQLSQG